MKKITYILIIALFIVVKPTHAYLDPGTGSFIFQALVASILAGSYFFRNSLRKVVEGTKRVINKILRKK